MADIEQVIQDSIADLPGREDSGGDDAAVDATADDSGLDASSEGASDEGQVAEDSSVPPIAKVEAEDDLAKELGIKPGRKNNRIPYDRVQAIVKKAQEKHAAELAQREQRIQELARYDAPDFRQQLDLQTQALKMLEEQPEVFLERLAEVDPRYAKLLRREQAQAESQQPQNASFEPDVQLPDGTLGWSKEAMQRMMDARAAQAASAAEQRIAKQFEQQFGPVVNDWRQAQIMRGAVSKAQQQIQQASSWNGFTENQAEILEALKADRSLSLEQAYIKIVAPKLAASKDDIRKQVLAEVNSRKPAASKGSVAPSMGATAAPSSGPRDTEDIIREAIANLPRK